MEGDITHFIKLGNLSCRHPFQMVWSSIVLACHMTEQQPLIMLVVKTSEVLAENVMFGMLSQDYIRKTLTLQERTEKLYDIAHRRQS